MVKVEVTATSGVPVIIAELDELFASVKPCGRLPELTDQENGKTPPAACNVWEYANVVIQSGKVAVVMDRAGGGGGGVLDPPQLTSRIKAAKTPARLNMVDDLRCISISSLVEAYGGFTYTPYRSHCPQLLTFARL